MSQLSIRHSNCPHCGSSDFVKRGAREFHLKQKFTINELQFDETYSIEHTKLKPLGIAIAVDDNYKILGVEVGRIKASGKLAAISYRKYGPRPNESLEQKYLSQEKHIFDPIFAVNHICAKLRDHIKRLARRSWCTTKIPEHLELSIYLYIAKNNKYSFL